VWTYSPVSADLLRESRRSAGRLPVRPATLCPLLSCTRALLPVPPNMDPARPFNPLPFSFLASFKVFSSQRVVCSFCLEKRSPRFPAFRFLSSPFLYFLLRMTNYLPFRQAPFHKLFCGNSPAPYLMSSQICNFSSRGAEYPPCIQGYFPLAFLFNFLAQTFPSFLGRFQSTTFP